MGFFTPVSPDRLACKPAAAFRQPQVCPPKTSKKLSVSAREKGRKPPSEKSSAIPPGFPPLPGFALFTFPRPLTGKHRPVLKERRPAPHALDPSHIRLTEKVKRNHILLAIDDLL